MMTYLMEGVIQRGTAASVRSRGFSLPAAGKTGTSRDGWFAGYTKDYIVIVWVGFDDNSDLNIEGAKSALPIWTEFMKKAQALYPPRDIDAMSFDPPEGIVQVNVERDTNELPIKGCTADYVEAYLDGTISPPVHCRPQEDAVSGFIGKVGGFFGRLFGRDSKDSKDSTVTEQSKARAEPSTSSH